MGLPTKIQAIIKEYKQVSERQSELSFQLSEHYEPIINKLLNDNDKDGLKKLLNEIPESLVKIEVYRALRELNS